MHCRPLPTLDETRPGLLRPNQALGHRLLDWLVRLSLALVATSRRCRFPGALPAAPLIQESTPRLTPSADRETLVPSTLQPHPMGTRSLDRIRRVMPSVGVGLQILVSVLDQPTVRSRPLHCAGRRHRILAHRHLRMGIRHRPWPSPVRVHQATKWDHSGRLITSTSHNQRVCLSVSCRSRATAQ